MEYRYMLYVLLSLLLTGCNGDIFVEEVRPETTELTVRCGEPATVRFNTGDWDIKGVSNGSALSGTVYDLEGNVLYKGFLSGGGLLQMRYEDELLQFTLLREQEDELTLTVDECLYDAPYTLYLQTGTDYSVCDVRMEIQPGAKYQVDSIVYSLDAFYYWPYASVRIKGYNVDNRASSQPVTFHEYPLKEAYRTEAFDLYTDGISDIPLSLLMGAPAPEVNVPDIEDMHPVMNGRRLPLTEEEQREPIAESDDKGESVTVGAGEYKSIDIYLQVEEYEIPFTLYISNPESGNRREFKGSYRSSQPYDYYILKSNLNPQPNNL